MAMVNVFLEMTVITTNVFLVTTMASVGQDGTGSFVTVPSQTLLDLPAPEVNRILILSFDNPFCTKRLLY